MQMDANYFPFKNVNNIIYIIQHTHGRNAWHVYKPLSLINNREALKKLK